MNPLTASSWGGWDRNFTKPYLHHFLSLFSEKNFLFGIFFTVSFVTAECPYGHCRMWASSHWCQQKAALGVRVFCESGCPSGRILNCSAICFTGIILVNAKDPWKHFYSSPVLLLILSICITSPFSCWLGEFSLSTYAKRRIRMSAPSLGSLPTAYICAPTPPFRLWPGSHKTTTLLSLPSQKLHHAPRFNIFHNKSHLHNCPAHWLAISSVLC